MIKIEDHNIGKITIEPFSKIDQSQNYAIKSLSMLMLMCINADEDREKFDKFLDIMKELTTKAKKLYMDDKENEFNPTSDF